METKYQVVSRLIQNVPPKDISLELEIPYSKVLRIKSEFCKAKENDKLDTFIDMDKVLMDQLLDQAKEDVPQELMVAAEEAVKEIKKAKSTLDMLSDDMVITAKAITTQIKSSLSNVQHVSEVESLTTSLCALQNAFFNSNKTQVNVQNNYGDAGNSAYGAFLSDKPTDN